MLFLTIRTDKPESEIGLFEDDNKLAYEIWQAHRQLAETIHKKIQALLKAHDKDWHDIRGVVAYEGPGSFTGLRIGLTVANTLAYGLEVPIIGARGEDWTRQGIDKILDGSNDNQVMPHYGAPVHITEQKK